MNKKILTPHRNSPQAKKILEVIKQQIFEKKKDLVPLSNSLLVQKTGLDQRNAMRTVKYLVKERIIVRSEGRWERCTKNPIISLYAISNSWKAQTRPDEVVKFKARAIHAFKEILKYHSDKFSCLEIAEAYQDATGETLSARKIGALLNKIGLKTRNFSGGNRGIVRDQINAFLKLKLAKENKTSYLKSYANHKFVTSNKKVTWTNSTKKINNKTERQKPPTTVINNHKTKTRPPKDNEYFQQRGAKLFKFWGILEHITKNTCKKLETTQKA